MLRLSLLGKRMDISSPPWRVKGILHLKKMGGILHLLINVKNPPQAYRKMKIGSKKSFQ
jgi:hypothetical protein